MTQDDPATADEGPCLSESSMPEQKTLIEGADRNEGLGLTVERNLEKGDLLCTHFEGIKSLPPL